MQEQELTFKSLLVPFTTKKAIVFIFIVGLIVFFNGFFNNFVRDDISQIIYNPNIQSLNNIPSFFINNRLSSESKNLLGGTYFKPLFDTLLTVIYAAFKANPLPFHIFQIFLYIINACVLFVIFKQFFQKRIAFITSLVFLIHPITNEVSLYISDLQEVLFLFFGLLSLLALKHSKSLRGIILTCSLLFLCLLSKETGILFVILCLFFAVIYKRKLFYLLLSSASLATAVYIVLRIHAIGIFSSLTNYPFGRLNLATRILNIPEVFFFYLRSFFYPFYSTSSYNWFYTKIDFAHFVVPLIIDLSFLILIVGFAIILLRKFSRKLLFIYLFFMIWFLMGLVPHLQIFPLDQTVAGRWFYFPLIGLLGMIAVLLETFKINFQNKLILVLLPVLILSLSFLTIKQTLDFRNDTTLTTRDLTTSKFQTDYNMEYLISEMYYSKGNLRQAKIHAEKSVQLFPTIINCTNLGAIYSSMGNYNMAKTSYLKALEFGEDSLPYENLSSLSILSNNQEDVDFMKNISLKKYPRDGIIWFNLAILQYKLGGISDAKKSLETAKQYYENPNLNFIDYIITNQKAFNINAKNGNVNFYTY